MYRDDRDALRAKVDELEHELGDKRQREEELGSLESRLKDARTELSKIEGSIARAQRPRRSRLPLVVTVAAAAMVGAVVLAAVFTVAPRPAQKIPYASPEPPPVAQTNGATGIKECDDYIAKWQHCNADPETRREVQQPMEDMVKAWRDAARGSSASRDALRTACKTMLETFPGGACR